MPRKAKGEQARLARERAAMVRRKERARLAELREDLRDAKRAKALRLRKLRADVKRGRARLQKRVAEFRREWREYVAEQVKLRRARAKAAWQVKLARAMRAPTKRVAGRSAALAEYRAELASLRRWTRQQQTRQGVRKAFEARAESDGMVANNLPPELRAVWRKVGRRVKTRVPGKTRTEAFLEWAAENPDDVLRAQWGDDEQAKLEKELREAEAAAGRVRKAARGANRSASDMDLLAAM